MGNKKELGVTAATSLVVANMIGTGVFVSLGYQLFDFNSAPPVMLLWVLGGVIALCGAFSYAALAKALPRSGGEYHYLGKIYHPSLGFMAGLLSAISGFALPTAITALAMGGYLAKAWEGIPAQWAAVAVVLLGAMAHGLSARTSGLVQICSTILKLTLIAVFLIAVIFIPGKGDIRWALDPAADLAQIVKPAFATALFYVFYAYSGWNAAVYGLEEWSQPEKTVRRALVGGTLLVTALYVGLNAAFLLAAPVADLRGNSAIAHAAAAALFGDQTGRVVSALFAIGLFASVSALLWAGPRVLGSMGRDLPSMRFFAPRNNEVPIRPLILQTVLAILFILSGDIYLFLTGTADAFPDPVKKTDAQLGFLISYTQTALTLCTLLSVFGLFLLKRRGPGVSKGTILPAAVFLAFTGAVMVWLFFDKPIPAIGGILTSAFCAALWFVLPLFNRKNST